jgi:hypothetical protein
MTFTEWLRVRGLLKWVCVILTAFLLIAGVARLALLRIDPMSFVSDVQHDPGSKTSTTTLPDGTKRTIVVNDRKQVRITIDDHGYDGERVDIVRAKPDDDQQNFSFGTLKVETATSSGGQETVIDTNQPTFFGDFAIVGTIVALIVATILGAPFAKESDGHLEIALTKPIGRLELASQTMLLDCGGIVAGFVIGVIYAAALHAVFQSLKVSFGAQDLVALGLGILTPVAWYCTVNALTASMKRGYGVVQGFALPVALLVYGLAHLPSGNVLRDAVRVACQFLCYLDPFYYALRSTPTTVYDLIALLVLALVYGTLAAFQWRRVEA